MAISRNSRMPASTVIADLDKVRVGSTKRLLKWRRGNWARRPTYVASEGIYLVEWTGVMSLSDGQEGPFPPLMPYGDPLEREVPNS